MAKRSGYVIITGIIQDMGTLQHSKTDTTLPHCSVMADMLMPPSLCSNENISDTHQNQSIYSCKTFLFASDMAITNQQLAIKA